MPDSVITNGETIRHRQDSVRMIPPVRLGQTTIALFAACRSQRLTLQYGQMPDANDLSLDSRRGADPRQDHGRQVSILGAHPGATQRPGKARSGVGAEAAQGTPAAAYRAGDR